MILAIDVGNSNIVIGCLDKNKKYFEGRISTNKTGTVEEYALMFKNVLELHKIELSLIEGGIISSVVTQLASTLCKAVELIIGKKPLMIGPGIKSGLNIKIDNPAQLGADLVVGAVASIAKYPLPQIVFDLGTATTASVIDKSGAYIGGMIIPGVRTALNAISSSTSQLPYIELSAPSKAIGTNTVDCMKSGSVFGTAAMLDGLIDRIEKELGEKACVVATGGIASMIITYCKHEIIFDDDLLIDGLLNIYYKNI